ncbi:MAG TPA: nuclear transport factor 2 family protein [Thermomicrobiales bacterium]|nr:nuclear transport factor 2 family protein [Thermomicrobiales bacterium]
MKNALEELVREITDALVRKDREYLSTVLTDDVQVDMAGRPPMQGAVAFLDAFAPEDPAAGPTITDSTLDRVITHGTAAAAHGTLTITAADGTDRTYAFCDIYTFAGHKDRRVRKFQAFVVETHASANPHEA